MNDKPELFTQDDVRITNNSTKNDRTERKKRLIREQLSQSMRYDYTNKEDMFNKQIEALDAMFRQIILENNLETPSVKLFMTAIRAQEQCLRTAKTIKTLKTTPKQITAHAPHNPLNHNDYYDNL